MRAVHGWRLHKQERVNVVWGVRDRHLLRPKRHKRMHSLRGGQGELSHKGKRLRRVSGWICCCAPRVDFV